MAKPRKIILAEDNPADAQRVKQAFSSVNIPLEVTHVPDGQELLNFLRTEYLDNIALVLLDLNMPRMGGLEFLEVIKGTEQFRNIPVIVLTTSAEDEDRLQSFNYSVAGYMVKPVDYENFVHMMRTINMYWTLSETPY